MEKIDIVIVANDLNPQMWEMTRNAVRTGTQNAGMEVGEVYIIEQCRHAREQPEGKTMYYDFEFNYNKCLNLGLSLSKNKYIAFCNNDLYFDTNWARNAVAAMKKGGYLSASPTGRHIFKGVIEGYDVGIKGQLLGWCIITDRAVFDKIGKFSEVVNFWYSDDVYGVQLRCAGIKHVLVGNSKVKHFRSRTILKIKDERRERTTGQKEIFLNYKKQMYANSGIEIEVKGGGGNRRKRKLQRKSKT